MTMKSSSSCSGPRARLLQRQQLVDLQVAAVGDRGVVSAISLLACCPASRGDVEAHARISAIALLRVTGPGFMT
jgi:hypothetical protein